MMAKRRYYDAEQQSGYEREPLVDIGQNTNARRPSATRRSLPAGNWGSDRGLPAMDKPDPRKSECMEVKSTTRFYVDCDDDRSQ